MDLHKLMVEITAENKKFKAKCDEVKAESKKTMNEANKQLAKIGDENKFASKITKQWDDVYKKTEATCKKIKQIANQSKIDAGLIEPTKEYKTLTKEIQYVEKELDRLRAKQNSMSDKDAREMTSGYSAVMDKIKSTETRLDSLIDKQQEWVQLGVDTKSSSFQRIENEIEEARKELDRYVAKQKQLESSGDAYSYTEKWKSLQREITAAKEKLLGYRAKEAQMASSGKDYQKTGKYNDFTSAMAQTKGFGSAGAKEVGKVIMELGKLHPSLAKAIRLAQSFGNTAKKAFNAGSKAASAVSAPLKVSTGFLKILGSGFGTVLTKLKGLVPAFSRVNRSMNSMHGSGSRLSRIWQTLKMTAGFMAASFVIMGSVNAAKQGFVNLSQYSEQTNADLSMLMSSLTQMKNSFATAFAPVLTVVAPILNTLIGYVTSATTALAHFFAALTGQSSVTVAKQVNQDFASSVADTGNAASDATSKAEKLKRILMGFDRINKLDSADSDSSGSASTALSPSQMFETAEVESVASGWAQKIKDAWAKADFTEIGEILGERLNTALSGIDWAKINTTLTKIAASIATFLNGFIDGTDWSLVGGTFANGINTLINIGYVFVTTFDWKKFGTAIASAVDGFVKDLDLSKAGKTFSNGIKGILNTINTALEETDWKAIGAKIGNFLTNIDWIGVLTSVGKTIVNAIVGVLDLADGLFFSICEGLKKINWIEVVKQAWELVMAAWGLNIKTLSVGISLFKNAWSTLKDFIGIDKEGLNQKINRTKGWKNTIREFLGLTKSSSDSKSQKISRKKGWTKSLSSWIGIDSKGYSQKIKLKKEGWSNIKKWLGIDSGFKLKFKLPKIKVTWGEKTVAGFKISYPNGFETYAKGGFPEEGPFMMNRGEIAGRFSNGKSVVANNQQITAGIASAVGPAVYDAVLAALMQGGGQKGSVTVILEGDAKKIFKVVKREADAYTLATGNPAFNY